MIFFFSKRKKLNRFQPLYKKKKKMLCLLVCFIFLFFFKWKIWTSPSSLLLLHFFSPRNTSKFKSGWVISIKCGGVAWKILKSIKRIPTEKSEWILSSSVGFHYLDPKIRQHSPFSLPFSFFYPSHLKKIKIKNKCKMQISERNKGNLAKFKKPKQSGSDLEVWKD